MAAALLGHGTPVTGSVRWSVASISDESMAPACAACEEASAAGSQPGHGLAELQLCPRVTVFDNIASPLRLKKRFRPDEVRRRVEDAAALRDRSSPISPPAGATSRRGIAPGLGERWPVPAPAGRAAERSRPQASGASFRIRARRAKGL
jgi:hypothetical protein